MEKGLGVSYKIKHTYSLSQPFHSGIYPREMKADVHKKTCIRLFIAVLFIVARNWKQGSCPTAEERKTGICKQWTNTQQKKEINY